MSEFGDIPDPVFRKAAHEVADWMADYLQTVDDLPVLAQVRPGDVAAALPVSPPADAESFESILRDFREIVVPGMTHWNHPRFHAWFCSSASGPGILGEALASTLNINAMVWRSGPAPTEMEARVLDWVRQMLGLPEGFEGHINDTASVSNLVALAAAREHATDGSVRKRGLAGGPRLRIYASEDGHSSVDKAAIVLGLGLAGVRKIPTDDAFRMRADALAEAIDEDRRDGWVPMCVVATVGTTSTTAVDPVPAIADLCEREKVWLHVDAAYGGSMALVPEFQNLLAGCDRADSFVVNPHKWMFVPIDLSALYARDPEMIRRAFSLVPVYLMTPEGDDARNLMDYGPALGRRFRALKLWMVIRSFGVTGMAARIRHHVELARRFAEWVDEEPGWERIAPVTMSLVLFRHVPQRMDDEDALTAHNQALLERVNATGRVFLSQSVVRGRWALRLAVGNLRTEERHLAETWELLQETARGV